MGNVIVFEIQVLSHSTVIMCVSFVLFQTFATIQTVSHRLRRLVPLVGLFLVVMLFASNDGGTQSWRDVNDRQQNVPKQQPMLQSKTTMTKQKQTVYQAKVSGPYNWIPDQTHPPTLTTDTGGLRCQTAKRNIKSKATVIVNADKDTFSLVNFTLYNMLQASRVSIGQVIVVCDGTVPPEAAMHIGKYLEKYVPRSTLLHIKHVGRAWSHQMAVKKAHEDVLVFLEAGSWIAQGWLDPMLHFLQDNSSSIAFPRYDVIQLTEGRVPVYKKLYFLRTVVMPWNLSSQLMTEYNFEDIVPTMNSLSMRGDVWAITKDYWQKLGGFDERLLEGGGAYTELALRVWLCGGTVRTVSCARVAILVTTTIPIDNKENLEYIVNKWMPEEINRIREETGENIALTNSYKKVHTNLQCSMTMGELMLLFDVDHVIYDPIRDLHPERNKTFQLRSQTGGCIMPLPNGNVVLDEKCGGKDYDMSVFEFTPDGYLQNVMYQLCLSVTSNHQVRVEACMDMELRQRWALRDDQMMISILKQHDCLRHTTHSVTGEQIPLLLPCLPVVHKDKQFERWQWEPLSVESNQQAVQDTSEESSP